MSSSIPQRKKLVLALIEALPQSLAIYAFGSRISDSFGPDSDLDLAVLVNGYAEPVALWKLSQSLIDQAGCAVDLLDLRAASTVMQYQVVVHGERWWAKDAQAALYESAILSERTQLDEARAGVLSDIQARGSVYGG